MIIDAAIEANAAAILVHSLYGHGELDCDGLRDRCIVPGLDAPLCTRGNLVVGKMPREIITQKYQATVL